MPCLGHINLVDFWPDLSLGGILLLSRSVGWGGLCLVFLEMMLGHQ